MNSNPRVVVLAGYLAAAFGLALGFAFGPARADGGFDWSKISFEPHPRVKDTSSWEIASLYTYYDDAAFDDDTGNSLRLVFRHTDRVSRSFQRFYRFQARSQSAPEDPNEAFLAFSATVGLRFLFGDGYRIDLPATLYYYNYHRGTGDNTNYALRFSPDFRMPLGENVRLRVRADLHMARYPNDPGRDRIELRLRPTLSVYSEGPMSYHFGLMTERRVANDPVFSRFQHFASITATRDIGDNGAYLDLSFLVTRTEYDASSTPPALATTSYVAEASYTHPVPSVEGLVLNAGVGYEWLTSNRAPTQSESPFLTLGFRHRF